MLLIHADLAVPIAMLGRQKSRQCAGCTDREGGDLAKAVLWPVVNLMLPAVEV